MQIGVPSNVTDEDLKQVATFRSRSRIPVIFCIQVDKLTLPFIVILPNGLLFMFASFRTAVFPYRLYTENAGYTRGRGLRGQMLHLYPKLEI